MYCISRYLYQRYSKNLFFFFFFFLGGGAASIAQLVEVAHSAVLGGVVKVVSPIPTVRHKNIFQHQPAKLLSLLLCGYIYIYMKNRGFIRVGRKILRN